MPDFEGREIPLVKLLYKDVLILFQSFPRCFPCFCIDLIYGYLWERLQPELRVDRSPPRPEGERPVLEGSAALRFLDALFGRMGAAGTGGLLAFRGSFFLLYELFTGTLEVKLFPDDNPGILASVPWA